MTIPPLSETERASVRHHMGYLNVGEMYTFVLGTPAAVETTFVIEGAMDRVLEVALPRFRQILGILDAIEAQRVDDLELMAINQLGDIQVNQKEQNQLLRTYDDWVAALANMLGVPRNPFDKRLGGARGVNVGVAG